jgi:SAM-dependent methyltransferase/8-oxo-dGTP pyrophosphatase MutT (NUDIX family)
VTEPRTTYDGEPIAEDPPFGASVVVWRRAGAGIELLVLHRAHDGPGYEGDWAWTPPAGARKPGEDLHACARRELKEETGLEAPIRPTPFPGDWPAYEAEVPPEATIVLDAEHDRFVWLEPADALDRCRPAIVAEQIRAALRQIVTAPVSQNIYDDPRFFAGYSRLRRSIEGLDGAAEWPAMRAMLPDMRGLKVVDLGCGMGWFCRWARAAGAAEVLGLDLSSRMLDEARSASSDPRIAYEIADLARLELPSGAFDLAYSSLAFHYVADGARLYQAVARCLAPGGRLVFSTEHPIYTAPTRPSWATGEDGETIWPLNRYQMEGQRVTDWLAPGVIKHHRTLATTLNLVISAGFVIDRIEEFRPSAEEIAAQTTLVIELERPMFLLVSAHRH